MIEAASQTYCNDPEVEHVISQVLDEDLPQVLVQDLPQVMNYDSDTLSIEYVTVMYERSQICEEFESMLIFEDVDDVPASFEEVEDLLENVETVKEVPPGWVLKKHGLDQTFES